MMSKDTQKLLKISKKKQKPISCENCIIFIEIKQYMSIYKNKYIKNPIEKQTEYI